VQGDDPARRTAKVSFDGVVREVNLSFLPDVRPGDYVIVHVGMALSRVDPVEAQKTIEDLRLIQELSRGEAL